MGTLYEKVSVTDGKYKMQFASGLTRELSLNYMFLW